MSINKKALQAKLQTDRENRSSQVITQNTEGKMRQVLSATSTVPQPKQKRKPKKETHKTYTVWVEKEKLAEWKAYIATKNIKSEDLALLQFNIGLIMYLRLPPMSWQRMKKISKRNLPILTRMQGLLRDRFFYR